MQGFFLVEPQYDSLGHPVWFGEDQIPIVRSEVVEKLLRNLIPSSTLMDYEGTFLDMFRFACSELTGLKIKRRQLEEEYFYVGDLPEKIERLQRLVNYLWYGELPEEP